MTDNQKQWFDALTRDRAENARVMAKSSMCGIRSVLTDLYPDNAHFIYELLQNAEDAGARTVRFTLTDTCVEFEHNGTRLFSEQDIKSITSIAYRKESLVGSHRARVAQLQEQLAQADDSKIRRMRQAQIDTAENDFKRRIADLEAAATRADILATPVVFGHIHIRQV